MKTHYIIGGGALLALGLVYWLTRPGAARDAGAAVGGAVVGAAVGVVSGAANAVIDAAGNPSINPLHGFGSWLGGTIYDVTHPAP